MDELYLDHKCDYCGEVTKAYPDKMFDNMGWSDYEGNRTNMVSIRFKTEHHCPPKEDNGTGPVEEDTLSPILDRLRSLSTPPKGVPPTLGYRWLCSDMVKELGRED